MRRFLVFADPQGGWLDFTSDHDDEADALAAASASMPCFGWAHVVDASHSPPVVVAKFDRDGPVPIASSRA